MGFAMATTATQFDGFLKEYYTNDKIAELVYKDRPALEHLKKDGSGSGRRCIQPILFGNPQGLGPTVAKAQAGAEQAFLIGGSSKIEDWIVPWGDYSGNVQISGKLLKQSRDNVGSFMRARSTEVDGIFNAFADTMAAYLFREGRNLAVGTINTGVITVTNYQDLSNIHVGMILVASADNGSSSSHALLGSGSAGYVFKVDRDAGTYTVATSAANAQAGTAGTPSGWTGTMYFFRDGDFGGTGAATIFDGYGAWIPSAAPGSTAFNGVDRSVAVQELGGTRIPSASLTGLGIEQRIKLLGTRLRQWGRPGPTHYYLNPTDWQRLADSLEARGYRMADAGEAKFNFSGIKVAVGGKMVEIHADPFCPVGTCFAIDSKVVTMYSLDKFVHVVNDDGLTMLRKVSTNDFEFRIESFPALVVAAPGNCGRTAV